MGKGSPMKKERRVSKRFSSLATKKIGNSDFTLGATSSIDLSDFVSALIEYGDEGADGNAKRREAFRTADPNGNGWVSLAELEIFIMASLKNVFPKERADALFRMFRPSYIYAFNNAKDFDKRGGGEVLAGAETATADDYVSFSEFRICIIFLCIYSAMYDAFVESNDPKDDDPRIELEEFLVTYRFIQGHGFKGIQNINSDEEAKALFRRIDSNDGKGKILFSEWSTFLR